MEIKLVDIKEELFGILKVQAENHPDNLSNESRSQNGFVTVKHSYEMLEKMNARAPQVIAKAHNEVIAYALIMLREFKNLIPVLIPMFETLETIQYGEKKLSELNYYVMGQICVKDSYKRKGIFKELYLKHREVYGKLYDCCVTEVSKGNLPSMIAHQKLGFKTIHRYTDHTDEWNILVWDWK